jgi:hypothetical protein
VGVNQENPIIVYCLKLQKFLPYQNYLDFITLIISDLHMLQRSWYVIFCSAFCCLLSQVQFFTEHIFIQYLQFVFS